MGRQSHRRQAGGVDAEQEARIRGFIARVDSKFTYATTIPEHPHSTSFMGPRLAWVVRTAPPAGEMSSLVLLLHAELA
jgi:hypothetical protein